MTTTHLSNNFGSQNATPESYNEAIFLLCISSVGLISNIAVVICILSNRHLRRTASAFIIHGCVLDSVRCFYCVPFAVSLLWDVAPGLCAVLGGSYVVVVTASGFNIVAMVCCEAYVFGEKSLHNLEEVQQHDNGSICCVAFGILMVYATSLIIHLGPTIIGGDFNYNDLIGNCVFVYGTIKSYVAQAMWIIITTLSMFGTLYYLFYFHRHVQNYAKIQSASSARASTVDLRNPKDERISKRILQQALSRCRVLITISLVFVFSWFPLFVLTLIDPKFQQPSKIYKLLTFIAWSNAAINPMIFILYDQSIDAIWR